MNSLFGKHSSSTTLSVLFGITLGASDSLVLISMSPYGQDASQILLSLFHLVDEHEHIADWHLKVPVHQQDVIFAVSDMAFHKYYTWCSKPPLADLH